MDPVYLDSSHTALLRPPHAQIPPKAKAEIPLWMVPTLAANDLIEPGVPNFYGEKRRRELAVSALEFVAAASA